MNFVRPDDFEMPSQDFYVTKRPRKRNKDDFVNLHKDNDEGKQHDKDDMVDGSAGKNIPKTGHVIENGEHANLAELHEQVHGDVLQDANVSDSVMYGQSSTSSLADTTGKPETPMNQEAREPHLNALNHVRVIPCHNSLNTEQKPSCLKPEASLTEAMHEVSNATMRETQSGEPLRARDEMDSSVARESLHVQSQASDCNPAILQSKENLHLKHPDLPLGNFENQTAEYPRVHDHETSLAQLNDQNMHTIAKDAKQAGDSNGFNLSHQIGSLPTEQDVNDLSSNTVNKNLPSNDEMGKEIVHVSINNCCNVNNGDESNESLKIDEDLNQNVDMKETAGGHGNAAATCYEQDANSQAGVYICHENYPPPLSNL